MRSRYANPPLAGAQGSSSPTFSLSEAADNARLSTSIALMSGGISTPSA